jgi:hypothetical protein
MRKRKLHFEQVPIEVVKKIAGIAVVEEQERDAEDAAVEAASKRSIRNRTVRLLRRRDRGDAKLN